MFFAAHVRGRSHSPDVNYGMDACAETETRLEPGLLIHGNSQQWQLRTSTP
jgi:hypothetical protein